MHCGLYFLEAHPHKVGVVVRQKVGVELLVHGMLFATSCPSLTVLSSAPTFARARTALAHALTALARVHTVLAYALIGSYLCSYCPFN